MMNLSKRLKNILLVAIILGIPLLIIGLFNLSAYINKTIECRSSNENLFKCHLESVCKDKDIQRNCFDRLKESVSGTVNRALEENNAKICEEVEPKLTFICYYHFAKNLEFSQQDVFFNNLKGQDGELCNGLSGSLRKKCFFNLAIEKLNTEFCKETEEYMQRCASNIFLLQKNLTKQVLVASVRSRMAENASKLNFKHSRTVYESYIPGTRGILGVGTSRGAEEYFIGEKWIFEIYNDGSENLDGSKFNLYKNFRLVDTDGCKNNAIVYPKNESEAGSYCILEFNVPVAERIMEVTYDGETIYVPPD